MENKSLGMIIREERKKKVPLTKAYNYIVTFKGIDFMRQYQDIEKTLSNHEIVSDVSRVCANNGGRL